MTTAQTNLRTIDGALKRLNLSVAGGNVSLGNAFEEHGKLETRLDIMYQTANALEDTEYALPDSAPLPSGLEDLHTELMNLRHCLNNVETELKTIREANKAAVEELAFYKEEYYKNENERIENADGSN